jgi:hypothetical protein
VNLPRSAIPRVVGILAIIFAPIGMLWSYAAWSRAENMSNYLDTDRVAGTIQYLRIYFFISIALFLAHFVGGVLACMYRKLGRSLLTGYAIGALLLLVVNIYMEFMLPGEGRSHDRHGWGALFRMAGNLVSLPWPIVVVVLINTTRSKLAFGQGPQQYMYPDPPPNQQ